MQRKDWHLFNMPLSVSWCYSIQSKKKYFQYIYLYQNKNKYRIYRVLKSLTYFVYVDVPILIVFSFRIEIGQLWKECRMSQEQARWIQAERFCDSMLDFWFHNFVNHEIGWIKDVLCFFQSINVDELFSSGKCSRMQIQDGCTSRRTPQGNTCNFTSLSNLTLLGIK